MSIKPRWSRPTKQYPTRPEHLSQIAYLKKSPTSRQCAFVREFLPVRFAQMRLAPAFKIAQYDMDSFNCWISCVTFEKYRVGKIPCFHSSLLVTDCCILGWIDNAWKPPQASYNATSSYSTTLARNPWAPNNIRATFPSRSCRPKVACWRKLHRQIFYKVFTDQQAYHGVLILLAIPIHLVEDF